MKKKEDAYRTRKEMADKPGYVRCVNLLLAKGALYNCSVSVHMQIFPGIYHLY
jgi:hypothetical protein